MGPSSSPPSIAIWEGIQPQHAAVVYYCSIDPSFSKMKKSKRYSKPYMQEIMLHHWEDPEDVSIPNSPDNGKDNGTLIPIYRGSMCGGG